MKRTLSEIYNAINLRVPENIYVNKKHNRRSYKDENNEVTVFLTVADETSIGKVIKGKGKNLREAIHKSIDIFINQFPTSFNPNQIKLDIVRDIIPITKDENNEWQLKYNFRKFGLSLDSTLDTSVTSEEITGFSIIHKRKVNINHLLAALENNFHRTSKTELEEMLNTNTLFRFNTRSYFIDANNFTRLVNGVRRNFKLNEDSLFRSIELTKNNYFKHVVEDDGKFIYSYLPSIDENESKYNILRHAGTIYSMLEVYELMPDEKLLEEINKAIQYLIKTTKTVKINNKKTSVIVERDVNKLGGNGLAIVALAKYSSVTNDHQYQLIMEELAEWIIQTQADNGEFTIHKQDFSTGELYDFTSRFYPGEAILALVRLYQINQDERLINTAENAAKFLINHRDRNETIDTITPDHWLLYGLNELHEARADDVYLNHAYMMAEAMMNKQLTKDTAKRREWIGGYQTRSSKAPGLTTTACWSEGLTATYNLAERNGNITLMDKIKDALNNGVNFQLQAQLRPETTLFYKNKDLCLGAMPKSLGNHELRIDYTQHNISSFVHYYRILTRSS